MCNTSGQIERALRFRNAPAPALPVKVPVWCKLTLSTTDIVEEASVAFRGGHEAEGYARN